MLASKRSYSQRMDLRSLLLLSVALGGCVSAPPRPIPPTPTPTPAPAPAPEAPAPAEIEKIPQPTPRSEPRSAKGNPPFYNVLGKRYFVLKESTGYLERGIASWYGPGFHAASTSNGERYDMYAMTAAHKTLPLPCFVQVTNLRNGRSVVVRVNDRGPFKDGRIIDLSYTAASKLDMLRDGTTFVEVRALAPENGPATTPGASSIYVQAGAFSSESNAAELLERLRASGVKNGSLSENQVGGRTLYRVRVGPVPSVGEYDRVVSRLKALGIADARLAD
jgi:rare lipoprotein A